MNEMEKIQRRLEDDFKVKTEIDSSGLFLRGSSELITVLVAAPHDHEHMWLLRMAPSASFDRWANSTCIEERFDSAPMLRTYFYLHQKTIFMELFKTLSEDYMELNEECERVRDFRKKVEE